MNKTLSPLKYGLTKHQTWIVMPLTLVPIAAAVVWIMFAVYNKLTRN